MVAAKISVPLVIGLALFVGKLMRNIGVGKMIETTDSKRPCRIVGKDVLIGSEDLVHYKDGTFLTGSGDLGTTNFFGAGSAIAGSIHAYDIFTGSLRKLETKGFNASFQPHGMFLSNTTRRLYVVSHTDEAHGSGIEIFDVVDEPELHLRYVHRVESPLFESRVINDVVEGSSDGSDIYVTRYLFEPHPVGTGESTGSLLEMLKRKFNDLVFLFRLPVTKVFHCKVASGSSNCRIAASGLVSANGITISKERKVIFVADPGSSTIEAYERSEDGSLIHRNTIATKHACDNLQFNDAGSGASIWCGSMPLLFKNGHVEEKLKEKPWHNEDVGVEAPGGLLEIQLDGLYSSAEQIDVILHNGSVLNSVSAGLRYGDKVLLGTPHARGLAVCTVDAD